MGESAIARSVAALAILISAAPVGASAAESKAGLAVRTIPVALLSQGVTLRTTSSEFPLPQWHLRNAALAGPDSPPRDTGSAAWGRVFIADVYTRHAARQALNGAAGWLASTRCQTLFSEFRGQAGRPLADRLDELDVTPAAYLALVVFMDDPGSGRCANHGTLAFTECGSRVVYLCGRDFERAWRLDAMVAQATIVHEILHSLGLGENPPSPRYITHRILALCWP